MNENQGEHYFPIYHHHQLTESDRPSFCNICFSIISTTESHFCCSDCDFDLCNKCLNNHQDELFTAINNIIKMTLDQETEDKEKQSKPSLNQEFVQHAISSSRPKIYLFEEQKEWPNNKDYQIEATSLIDNNKGIKLLYFTSKQANKMMGKCNTIIKKYVKDHQTRFALLKNIFRDTKDYLFLQEYDCGFDIPKIPIIGDVTYYASYLLGKYGLNDVLEKAKNAEIFREILQTSSQTVVDQNNKLGCMILMETESKIKKYNNVSFATLIPDLLPSFDWSKNFQTDLLPKISSLIELFNEQYADLKMKNLYYELNLICGALDYLEEGLLTLKQNRKLSEEDRHSIELLFDDLGELQLSLRIEPMELTILQTTVPNVYQTREKKIYHAFLSFEKLISINQHLVNDIVTSLKNLTDGKDIDLNDQEKSIKIINSFIKESEIDLINFFNDNSKAILKYADAAFSLAFESTLYNINQNLYHRTNGSTYNIQNDQINQNIQNDQINQNIQNDQINQNIQNDQISQNIQNDQIIESTQIDHNNNDTQQLTIYQLSQFNKDLINIFNGLVKKYINKSFIDFCNETVGRKMSEIAERKHLKEILKLTYEIERMKNQNSNENVIGDIYSIDLIIEKCDESIQKYRIQKIVNHEYKK